MRQQTSIFLVATFAALLLLSAVVANTEGRKIINLNVNIKFYGNAECIAQKTDEAYFRFSSPFKDPETGEHTHLIIKGEREHLGEYLMNLEQQGLPLLVQFKGKFDLDKWQKKYHEILKTLREYIELYNHINGQKIEIFDEYKYQPFTPKTRSTYTFNHGVDLGCR